MNLLLICLLYLLHEAAVLLLFHSRLTRKKTWLFCTSITLLQTGIALNFYWFAQEKTWLYKAFIATFLLFLIEVFFISADNFFKTTFLVMTYVQIFLILIFCSGLLANWLCNGDPLAAHYIRTFLHGIMLFLYKSTLRNKFDAIRDDVITGWRPMCLLSVLYTVNMSYVTVLAQEDSFHHVNIFSFLLLMATIGTGYNVIFRTVYYMREAVLNSQLEQHQKILLKKLEIMEETEEESRRLRHDLRHHLLNIAEHAKKGEISEILAYLGEYSVEIEKTSRPRLCANSAINNILIVYKNLAEEENIHTNFSVNTGENIGIHAVDLVALLANLLENALHGCLESDKEPMEIRVKIQSKAGKLSILVENTCKDTILFKNGLPKALGREGIGISSIQKSVEKYGSNVDFENKNGKFISRIIINTTEPL